MKQLVTSLVLLLPLAAWAAPDLGRVEGVIVEDTNRFRVDEGLPRLAPSRTLLKAAQEFADFMARTDRYGHEADGRHPGDRAAAQGYDFCLIAENIAYQYNSGGFTTTNLAWGYMEGWKTSPGHRKNMLEGAATETGVAVARSPASGKYYAVQMFGRPTSQAVEFEVRNTTGETIGYRVGTKQFSLRSRAGRIHKQCGTEDVTLFSANGQARDTARPVNGDKLRAVKELGGVAFVRERR